MKKFLKLICFLFLLYTSFVPESAEASQKVMSLPFAVLPTKLELIEGEALEGTAFSEIFLPEGTSALGEKAFARISRLSRVYLPFSIQYLSDSLFESSSEQLTLLGFQYSYAEKWAKSQGLPMDLMKTAYFLIESNAAYTGHRGERKIDLPIKKSEKPEKPVLAMAKSYIFLDMRPEAREELFPIEVRFP